MGKRAQISPSGHLKVLYQGADKDYPEFFDYIAQREHQDTIDVETILGVIPSTSRQDAITVAREMETIGVGKFVIGRRGSPTRLEWFFCSDSVGQVARGDLNELISLASEDDPGEESEMSEPDAGVGCFVHSFRLRPEESVRFQLPKDLTQQEASRLSEFIKSLPFE